jgi:hypothetical protein
LRPPQAADSGDGPAKASGTINLAEQAKAPAKKGGCC